MKRMILIGALVGALMGALVPSYASANPEKFTDILKRATWTPHPGAAIPMDTGFIDEAGNPVKLSAISSGKPMVLVPAYYECPNLCTQVLNGLVAALREITPSAGKQFQVVIFSINPAEEPKLAAAKKATYLLRYGRAGAGLGWHFLTGTAKSSAAVASALGFRYWWDARTHQYAHESGIAILTPKGRVARYFFGVRFSPKKLQAAIASARHGRVSGIVDRILLFCFHYDPELGRYDKQIHLAIQVFGILTVVALFGGIAWLAMRKDGEDAG